jgi:hypothetical protein
MMVMTGCYSVLVYFWGEGVEGLVRGIVCFFSVDHGKLTREFAYLNFLRCLASFFTIWI